LNQLHNSFVAAAKIANKIEDPPGTPPPADAESSGPFLKRILVTNRTHDRLASAEHLERHLIAALYAQGSPNSLR